MKKYWFETQKGKIIRMMIMIWSENWYEDFELEGLGNIFVWNNSGPRLSELLKDWIVEVKYYENPKISPLWCHCYHRAKYKLKPEIVEFYRKLYLLEIQKDVLEHFEKPNLWKRLFW